MGRPLHKNNDNKTIQQEMKVVATQAQLDEFLVRAYPGAYPDSEKRVRDLKAQEIEAKKRHSSELTTTSSTETSPTKTSTQKSLMGTASSFFKSVAASIVNPTGVLEESDRAVHDRQVKL